MGYAVFSELSEDRFVSEGYKKIQMILRTYVHYVNRISFEPYNGITKWQSEITCVYLRTDQSHKLPVDPSIIIS